MEMMKALSVRAPWWWWILYGGKEIENRSRRTHYRGPILIHASTWWKEADFSADDDAALAMFRKSCPDASGLPMSYRERRDQGQLWRGHIVGVANITDCLPPPTCWPLRGSPEPDAWHAGGQFGWQLSNAIALKYPFPVKGSLGFFPVGLLTGEVNDIMTRPAYTKK